MTKDKYYYIGIIYRNQEYHDQTQVYIIKIKIYAKN